MDKRYNLTDKPNSNVKDDSPEWMDNLFNALAEKDKEEDYTALFDKKPQVHTCSSCGRTLAANEVGTCIKCSNK